MNTASSMIPIVSMEGRSNIYILIIVILVLILLSLNLNLKNRCLTSLNVVHDNCRYNRQYLSYLCLIELDILAAEDG